MAKNKQRKTKVRKEPIIECAANDTEDKRRPTLERIQHNAVPGVTVRETTRSAGMAVRFVPVIEQLRKRGVLTQDEYEALSYYRDQASLADHSPVRSCCDFSPRGGHGPGVAIMSASIETGRLERNMGALWPLCRAVCVDDWTLEQWALAEHGSMKGSNPPEPHPSKVAITTLELKYAAGGIVGR